MSKHKSIDIFTAGVQEMKGGTILVNRCQEGNPVLDHIQKVPWSYAPEEGNLLADYELGRTSCAFFLSLRYHKLHPLYIYQRLQKESKRHTLRILLTLVDQEHPERCLRELQRSSLLLDFVLVIAWSEAEAARYLETFKSFEYKSAEAIREKPAANASQRATTCITALGKSLNKTDALNLGTNFGSLRELVLAREEDLELVPGMGKTKIKELIQVLDNPLK